MVRNQTYFSQLSTYDRQDSKGSPYSLSSTSETPKEANNIVTLWQEKYHQNSYFNISPHPQCSSHKSSQELLTQLEFFSFIAAHSWTATPISSLWPSNSSVLSLLFTYLTCLCVESKAAFSFSQNTQSQVWVSLKKEDSSMAGEV